MAVEARELTGHAGDHVVRFYEHADELFASVGLYLAEGIATGAVTILIAATDHVAGFEAAMAAHGVDVEAARSEGTYIDLDATATLDRFMVDGSPDVDVFDEVIGGVIREAMATGRPVRAYGEMVAVLWDVGQVNGAIELESLWNGLGERSPFSLLCAYPRRSVDGVGNEEAMRAVCHLHAAVVATDDACSFDGVASSARAARQFVVETLLAWGDRAELVDDAALVATELATNAIKHARSKFTVRISSHPGRIHIGVIDASPVLPVPRVATPMATSGRGLGLISTLTTRWTAESIPDGKVVTVELTR